MNGLTTGNTLYDALILIGLPLVAFLANRYGLTSILVVIGEQLVKLKPAPKPDEPRPVEPPVAPVNGQALQYAASLQGKPVALEWIGLLQLLIPLILQIVEAFRQRTGRNPTPAEMSEIRAKVLMRYYNGEPLDLVEDFLPVEMPVRQG
jgi:hypothetical protein